LTATTDPFGHQITYAYDAANREIDTTDRDGRRRTFTYDNDNRLLTENWWSAGSIFETLTFVYDSQGELTSEQDPTSKYSFSYDPVGNLLSVDNQGTTGVPRVVLTFTYDNFNNRATLHDNLGTTISYSYNADNEMTSASMVASGTQGPQATFAYDATARLTGITRKVASNGANISSVFGYDNADRLTTITHSSSSVGALATFSYSYDGASQITQYTGPEGTLTYTYDQSGELTGVGDARSESYSYDLNGNRNVTGWTTGTNDELTADGTNTYAYDGEGNLLSQTRQSDGQVTNYTQPASFDQSL
jgi:YD repeat-containing protein